MSVLFPGPSKVFLWVLRFSPLLKNHHFQIPTRPGLDQEPLGGSVKSESLCYFGSCFFACFLSPSNFRFYHAQGEPTKCD